MATHERALRPQQRRLKSARWQEESSHAFKIMRASFLCSLSASARTARCHARPGELACQDAPGLPPRCQRAPLGPSERPPGTGINYELKLDGHCFSRLAYERSQAALAGHGFVCRQLVVRLDSLHLGREHRAIRAARPYCAPSLLEESELALGSNSYSIVLSSACLSWPSSLESERASARENTIL